MHHIHRISIFIIFVAKLLFIIEGKVAFYSISNFKIDAIKYQDAKIVICNANEVLPCVRNISFSIKNKIIYFEDLKDMKKLTFETNEPLEITSTVKIALNINDTVYSSSHSFDFSTKAMDIVFNFTDIFTVTVNLKIECQDGYMLSKCTDIDMCKKMPQNVCRNNGTCHSENDSMRCQCSLGYKGQFCDDLVDPCYKNRCSKDSTCRPDSESPMKHICDCKFGFSGTFCNEYTSPCKDNYCAYNATCYLNETEFLGYSCKCQSGFSGRFCAHIIDNCASNSSLCSQFINATCISWKDSHLCHCDGACMTHTTETSVPGELYPLPFKWPFSELVTFLFVILEALVIILLIITLVIVKTKCCRATKKYPKSYLDDNMLINDSYKSKKESIEFGTNYGRQPVLPDEMENRNSLNPIYDMNEMQSFSNNQLLLDNNSMSTFGRR